MSLEDSPSTQQPWPRTNRPDEGRVLGVDDDAGARKALVPPYRSKALESTGSQGVGDASCVLAVEQQGLRIWVEPGHPGATLLAGQQRAV